MWRTVINDDDDDDELLCVDAAKGIPAKFTVAYNQFWCGS